MTRTRQENIRLRVIFALVICFFMVAVARLAHLQLYLGDAYAAIVERQSSAKVDIPAERGMVYDRFGELVAKNVIVSSLYAWPNDLAEVEQVARYLEKSYGLRAGEAITKYKLEPRRFKWIKRRITDAESKQIAADSPVGLHLRPESHRAFPFGLVGKQILGFTDIDNVGQSGFELAYDSLLTGTKGYADVRRDGLRKTYQVEEAALVKPIPGKSVVLTVDWRLQDIVESELARAVDTFNAQQGMAVFIDTRNGDILAMAHYDPSEQDPERPTKLRAISDQYEPGSVFKIFTAAGVLDRREVNHRELINCENGAWKVGRRVLHDDKRHGEMNFREIIEVSSNIGIAKWAITVDPEEMFGVYKKFGFGKKLKCGLPGEASGRLMPPPKWSDFTIAQLAMGHAVAITPLQLAAAIGVVANGGELLRPRLIVGYVDDQGYVVEEQKREVLSRVVDDGTDSLRAFMRGVVERGTAKAVNSKMVSIAGKTGTAQLPDLATGRYFQNKYAATFGGFFPYESPTIAGAVILIDPQPLHYGGLTSGPAFRKIVERYAVLNPDLITLPERTLAARSGRVRVTVDLPNFVGRDLEAAKQLAEVRGIKLRTTADEGTVVWQFPPPDRKLAEGDEVVALVDNPADSVMRMPDLTGLPLKKVTALLSHVGVKFHIRGTGRVVATSLEAGKPLDPTVPLQVECQPI
jgi:cell division protein FtsI (penicillin-binding protein 3)